MISDSLHTKNLYPNPAFPYIMFTINRKCCTPPGPGYRYLHWHKELQFTMVTRGSLDMQVNGILYHLGCGDAIFINRGLLHTTRFLSDDGEYVSFNFAQKLLSVFSGSIFEQKYVLPFTINYNYPVLLLSSQNPLHTKSLSLLSEMKEKNFLFCAGENLYDLFSLLTSLWAQMLFLFKTLPKKASRHQVKKQEDLQAMLSFIHQNFASDISIAAIAGSANVSISECTRCFKNLLRFTPYEYLLNFRITKATELLADTNCSVAEIATMTGFNDSSHFIQYFKRIQKITPGQYRLRHLC